MAEYFDKLEDKHCEFIKNQLFFMVATAPEKGRINVSPKGLDYFRIIDNNTVAYLDLVGSANETGAHLFENGRITIMFMSVDRNPVIMRLYGKGEALQKKSNAFKSLIGLFPQTRGVRQIMRIKIESVSTSCGYGVPTMSVIEERKTLNKWVNSKDDKAMNDYMREKNLTTIDGAATGLVIDD